MAVPTRLTLALAIVLLGTSHPGCSPDRRRITPTTTGTDLRDMPRGRMIPQSFPGTDLARNSRQSTAGPLDAPSGLKTDPATITTGVEP